MWDGKQTLDGAVHTDHAEAVCVHVFSLRSGARCGELSYTQLRLKYAADKMNNNRVDTQNWMRFCLTSSKWSLYLFNNWISVFVWLNFLLYYLWLTCSLEFWSVQHWLFCFTGQRKGVFVCIICGCSTNMRCFLSVTEVIAPNFQIATTECWVTLGIQKQQSTVVFVVFGPSSVWPILMFRSAWSEERGKKERHLL